MSTSNIALGSLCCALLVTAVAQAEQQTEEAPKVTFEEHVKPILRQHCLSCHNQGDKKGGLALDSYTALKEGGGSGEIVYDDGDADGSRLWQLVNHDDTPVMPPNQDKIPAEQLAVIRSWIEGGILENSGSKAKKQKKSALAFDSSGGGRPAGGGAMPESLPQATPVVTDRAAAITAIAASPWAPLVAIAGQKQVVMYHADTNELLGILPFEEGVAQSIRFSRDGSYLVVGGGEHSVNGLVAVFDVKTGERVAWVGDELDTVFDGDVNDTMTRIALGGPQKMLRIYDVADGQRVFDLKKHTDWIYAVAYTPDGILVASGDRSGGLCVWEADTGRLYLDLTDHKGAIRAVAWRDDSNVLASASEDGTVKLWDMIQGKAVKSFNAHGGGVTDVAFDHEGRLITSGKDNRVSLWDPSGNKIRDLKGMSESVLEVAITHDGKKAVYGDWNGNVMAVSTENPDQVDPLAANPPPAAVRLDQVKQTLVSVQDELQPLQAALQTSEQSLAEAQEKVDALNRQIEAKRMEAAQAEAEAEANRARVAAIDAELPALTNASRDAHDAVIVGRVNLRADAAVSETVAAAEQALAEQLLKLAGLRRERLTAESVASQHDEAASARRTEAEQLAATMPPLVEALETARQASESARAAHDQVATRLEQVKSRHDQLAAAVH